MKNPPRRKTKPTPAKVTAPVAPEPGREYRQATEEALANATPDEMRQLAIKLAIHADGLTAKIWGPQRMLPAGQAIARQIAASGR
jgi:hypothetical protein